MQVVMLGCGSSAGVPLVGCECDVCTSSNPKNKRKRVSALVKTQEKQFLIDASPDLRQQALDNNISRIDAVLFTHEHADHTHGIDDLRSFNFHADNAIPVFADSAVLNSLQTRFDYAFKSPPQHAWYRPSLASSSIPAGNVVSFDVLGIPCTAFTQTHGKSTTRGFRIGDFAYSTDVNELPEAAFKALEGVKVWFVDCLKYTPSFSHSYLQQTLQWIERVKPQRAVLTHMTHDFDYDKLAAELPEGIEPGYDGLMVDL